MVVAETGLGICRFGTLSQRLGDRAWAPGLGMLVTSRVTDYAFGSTGLQGNVITKVAPQPT